MSQSPTHPVQPRSVSPKELAKAIGVSESSVKRWSDAGLIAMVRTVGGHRRIDISEALRFIRKQGMQIVRPDLIGFPGLPTVLPEADEEAQESLFQLLKDGQRDQVRRLITAAYLNGMSLARLFDDLLSGALHRLGELWHDGDQGIFEEHVGTNICIEALHELMRLIPTPPDGAPVALGGAPEDDPYLLPSLMVAALFAETGYQTINLGPRTPVAAFHHAIAKHQPRMVWVSITSDLAEQVQHALVQNLALPLQAQPVEILVGGRSAQHTATAWPAYVNLLDSMNALATFIQEHTPLNAS